MSWSSYTDNLVSRNVDMCGIYGINGIAWAEVDTLKCSPDEIVQVIRVIVNRDTGIYGTGVTIAGKKWTVILLEGDDSLLVTKGKDPDNQKQTLVVALSKQAVVVGTCSDKNAPGSAVLTPVVCIRDYLKSCGY